MIEYCVLDTHVIKEICKRLESHKQKLKNTNVNDVDDYASTTFAVDLESESHTSYSTNEFLRNDITKSNAIDLRLSTYGHERIDIQFHFKYWTSTLTVEGDDETWVRGVKGEFEQLLSKSKRRFVNSNKRKIVIAFILTTILITAYAQIGSLANFKYFNIDSIYFIPMIPINFLAFFGLIYMAINWAYPKIAFKNQNTAAEFVKNFIIPAIAIVNFIFLIYSYLIS